MADITKTVAVVFQGQDQASPAAEKLADNLKTVEGVAGQANVKLDDLAQSTEKLGGTAKSVIGLTDAMKALAASLVFKAFVDANVEAEKFERAMVLLKGTSRAAGDEFAYVRDTANTLGLGLFDTADAYISLTAATKGTTLEGQATRDIFEAVSKAMATLGKSSADTQGALLAVSQMVSKGTVSMEELRGQLGERLPGAFQLAAKAMGLTTQELDDLVSKGSLTATEFLPKFAQALKDTFGDTSAVEGYAASFARLQNGISQAFLEIGKAGAFDALTKGVQVATAAVVGAVAQFRLLGEIYGAIAGAVVTRDFSNLGDTIQAAFDKAANSTRGARDAMFGYTDSADDAGTVTEQTANQITGAADDIAKGFDTSTEQSEKLNASLKALGIKPEQIKQPIEQITKAFEDLAANPAASGDQILAGLAKALKSADTFDDITRLGGALTQAFVNGRLSAEDFSKATLLLADDQKKVSDALERTTGTSKTQTEELKKNEEAARKAEEAAQKYALEMEKIAANERIKLIEARVTLNVAQIEADTKRVEAMFESINNTINSTGDVIQTALGQIKDLIPNTENFDVVQQQLEIENKLRRDAFELQKQLTQEQIANMRAQTQALLRGDAIIKIDGAGLQPHLEAFMWEILRTIQVRVNQQGLGLLLGV